MHNSDRSISLNDINFQWNSTDKNLSISRKLDTSPLHEVSFVSDATNNEKFGIKYYPHNVVMDGSNIVVTSGNGEPVDVTFAGLEVGSHPSAALLLLYLAVCTPLLE